MVLDCSQLSINNYFYLPLYKKNKKIAIINVSERFFFFFNYLEIPTSFKRLDPTSLSAISIRLIARSIEFTETRDANTFFPTRTTGLPPTRMS